jgi:catechol 2,3-dioxygenase-like lactoylglutathione lyase family enzyme
MEYVISNLLKNFERGHMTRRQLVQSLALVATAASAATATPAAPQGESNGNLVQALGMIHVSYMVGDYAKMRDFYVNLFGMKPTVDDPEGQQVRLSVGNDILIIRGWECDTPRVDHISYKIANFDKNREAIGEELQRRGLKPEWNGHSAYHFRDPEGFDIEIQGAGSTGAFGHGPPGEHESHSWDPSKQSKPCKSARR